MAKMNAHQAAEHAGVSASLVYQWCAERRLPHFRLGKSGTRGKLLIEQADLDAFLTSLRVEVEQEERAEGLNYIRRR